MLPGSWLLLAAAAGPLWTIQTADPSDTTLLPPDLVVAHSLGACAALRCAPATAPLVLIAPALPAFLVPWARLTLCLLAALPSTVAERLFTVVASLVWPWWWWWRWEESRRGAVHEPFESFLSRHRPMPGPATQRWARRAVAMTSRHADVRCWLPDDDTRPSRRVLVILGECDPLVSTARTLASIPPGVAVHIVRGAGHLLAETHTPEVWRVIDHWHAGWSLPSGRRRRAAGGTGWWPVVLLVLVVLVVVRRARRD